MPVIKDLVPDLTDLYAQYASIEPWLKTDTPQPQNEWRQSREDREQLDGLYEWYFMRLLLNVVSELLVEFRQISWPGSFASAYRWLADSRDEKTGDRLDDLEDRSGFIAAIRL